MLMIDKYTNNYPKTILNTANDTLVTHIIIDYIEHKLYMNK